MEWNGMEWNGMEWLERVSVAVLPVAGRPTQGPEDRYRARTALLFRASR